GRKRIGVFFQDEARVFLCRLEHKWNDDRALWIDAPQRLLNAFFSAILQPWNERWQRRPSSPANASKSADGFHANHGVLVFERLDQPADGRSCMFSHLTDHPGGPASKDPLRIGKHVPERLEWDLDLVPQLPQAHERQESAVG